MNAAETKAQALGTAGRSDPDDASQTTVATGSVTGLRRDAKTMT